MYRGGVLLGGQAVFIIPRGTGGGNLTVGDVLVRVIDKYNISIPYSGRVYMNNSFLNNGCANLALWTFPERLMTLGSCVPLTPVPVTCDIAGNTTIDHKTLLDNALNGAQASTQLNLKCDRSASVTIRATRTNSYGVSLKGDSLYSEVRINGMDATDGINISAIGNLDIPVNISSTLKARGAVAPGPFSGSTVITVSPN